MKTHIRTQGFDLTPSLEHITRHRFEQTLRRYGNSISSVELHLRDTNGPKGGQDKVVFARIRLLTGVEIVVEETRSDLYHSIRHCASRARRAVRRSLQKSRRVQPGKLRKLRRRPPLEDSLSLT